jgi:hypothetical protein
MTDNSFVIAYTKVYLSNALREQIAFYLSLKNFHQRVRKTASRIPINNKTQCIKQMTL